MIDRYQTADMAAIWSEENKFRRWLDVELAVTEAWAELGAVPRQSLKRIRAKANFDAGRIAVIEKKVKHDVIAFLTSVEEFVGDDSAYIHRGITSYDVVDTALSLLLRESLQRVSLRLEKFSRLLLNRAFQYRDLVTIGRTHGVHAEPITLGVKFLVWHEEMTRNLARLKNAAAGISVGKISGSVGTYAHFPPAGEAMALKRLGLKPCRAATQVIQRDRHADVLSALAILASSIEKIAVEIRHLQRTEVLEAEEPFTPGQKGSSSMPHKRNPVRCERISGMARLLRANLGVALENNVLWHERDISHSSAERVIFPDSFHLTAFMLDDIHEIIRDLIVYPENIRRNLNLTQGIYHSQKLLTLLVEKGLARQRAYETIQRLTSRAWRDKISLQTLALADPAINRFCSPAEVKKTFSEQQLQAGIKAIFSRFSRQGKKKRG